MADGVSLFWVLCCDGGGEGREGAYMWTYEEGCYAGAHLFEERLEFVA